MSDTERFCKAVTKAGQPCQAPPSEGGLCYFHAHPEQARILGQKGGRKNRYQVTDLAVPEDASAAGLGAVLDQALRELLAGRMDPRVAGAVAQLVNTRRRITEAVDLEARVARLEQKFVYPKSADLEEASAPPEQSDLPLRLQKESGNGEERGDGNANNDKV